MAQSEVALDWGYSVFGHPGPSLQLVPVLRDIETETQKEPHSWILGPTSTSCSICSCQEPCVTTPNTQLVLSYQGQGEGEEALPHLSTCKGPPNKQGFLSNGSEGSSPSPPPPSAWLALVSPLPS